MLILFVSEVVKSLDHCKFLCMLLSADDKWIPAVGGAVSDSTS